MQVHLIGFEAWNITRYLFVTNKRREIAGASELVTYLDRRWVHDALREMYGGFDETWLIEERPAALLETGAGSALVLLRDARAARQLVTKVTTAALLEAPGLDVFGAVSGPFDWEADDALADAVAWVRASRLQVRASRPGPDCRLLRLPMVDE